MRVFVVLFLILSIHFHQGISLHRSLSLLRDIDSPSSHSDSSRGKSTPANEWIKDNMDQITSLVPQSMKEPFRKMLPTISLSIQLSVPDRTLVFQAENVRVEVHPSRIHFHLGEACYTIRAPSLLPNTQQLFTSPLPLIKKDNINSEPITQSLDDTETEECRMLSQTTANSPINMNSLFKDISSISSLINSLPTISLIFFTLLSLVTAEPNKETHSDSSEDHPPESPADSYSRHIRPIDDEDEYSESVMFLFAMTIEVIVVCLFLKLVPRPPRMFRSWVREEEIPTTAHVNGQLTTLNVHLPPLAAVDDEPFQDRTNNQQSFNLQATSLVTNV